MLLFVRHGVHLTVAHHVFSQEDRTVPNQEAKAKLSLSLLDSDEN
jgi:hypothetical protein